MSSYFMHVNVNVYHDHSRGEAADAPRGNPEITNDKTIIILSILITSSVAILISNIYDEYFSSSNSK